jgi:hypothetical protein
MSANLDWRRVVVDVLRASLAGLLFAFWPLGHADVASGLFFGTAMFVVLTLASLAFAPLRQSVMQRSWLAQLLVGLVILLGVTVLVVAAMLNS